MPFALLIVGFVLIIASARNTQDNLFALVKADFVGPNNFIFWVVSILIIGAIGYIPKLKPISTAFLVLVILVLILTRGNPNTAGGGFFEKFTQQLNTTTTATAAQPTPTATPGGTPFSLPSIPSLANIGGILN